MADDQAEEPRAGLAVPVLVAIVGFAVAVLYAFEARDAPEVAWRLAGGLLQLGGFGVGAFMLAVRRIEFGNARRPAEWLRDTRRRLRRRFRPLWLEFRKLIGWPAPERDASKAKKGYVDSGIDIGESVVRHLRPTGDASLERRVEYLDEEVANLKDRFVDERERRRRDVENLERKMAGVRRESREGDRRLEEQIRGVAVGSLRWEYVALAWFVIGILATTWSGSLPSV